MCIGMCIINQLKENQKNKHFFSKFATENTLNIPQKVFAVLKTNKKQG